MPSAVNPKSKSTAKIQNIHINKTLSPRSRFNDPFASHYMVTPNWPTYHRARRQLDAIVDHGRAISDAVVGEELEHGPRNYVEQLYVKLLSHCITLQNILPPVSQNKTHLWDISSAASIARCAIEAHTCIYFISSPTISDEESVFRVALWDFVDTCRRLAILTELNNDSPNRPKLSERAEKQKDALKGMSIFKSVSAELRKKIDNNDPPHFHISKKTLCAEMGINYGFYSAAQMHLSQSVHSLPMSITNLMLMEAGDEKSVRAIVLPIYYTLPFLSRATKRFREIFPNRTPQPPARTRTEMETFIAIAAIGMDKNAW